MSISVDVPLVVGFLRRAILEGVPLWPWQLLLIAIAVVSAGVLYRQVRPSGRVGRRLRSRLLLGIPWGTALTVAFLLAVYLFVQGAYSGDIFSPQPPVTYPFYASSFEYPLGIVTASFAHGGFGHFLGNAIALAVFGSICEYAVGHFPQRRGAQEGTDWRTSPYLRPLAIFVGFVLAGLALAVTTPGPVIGFSGVIYGLAGFALLVRPLSAVVGILGVEILRLLYSAFTTPVSTFTSGGLGTRTVWFADVSAIGHFLGFLVGVLVAVVYLRSRNTSPSRSRVFGAVLVYGLTNQLWLVYWPAGNGQFVLHRAAGVALVFGW
jgi:membrane associated rhomboid family serine protease